MLLTSNQATLRRKAAPGVGEVLVSQRILDELASEYMQMPSDFVADAVFPRVMSDDKSGDYPEWVQDEILKARLEIRSPRSESASHDDKLVKKSYDTRVYSGHRDVSDQEIANENSIIDSIGRAARFELQVGRQTLEEQFGEAYMKDGVWTFNIAGTGSNTMIGDGKNTTVHKWNTDDGDARQNITDAKRLVHRAKGYTPNLLAIPAKFYDFLVNSGDLADWLPDNMERTVTLQAIARYFAVERCVVFQARDEAESYFVEDEALLAYAPANKTMWMPSAGVTIGWTGYTGMAAEGVGLETFRMPHLKCERVEAEMAFTCRLQDADLGVRFHDIV